MKQLTVVLRKTTKIEGETMSKEKTPLYTIETIELLESVQPISRDKAFIAAARECIAQGVGVSAMRKSLKEYKLGVSNEVASAVHAALVEKPEQTDPELLTLIEKTRKDVAAAAKKTRAEKKAEAEQAKAEQAKAEQAEAEKAEAEKAEAEKDKLSISVTIVAAISAAREVGLTDVEIAAAIAAATTKKVAKKVAKKASK